MVLVTGATGLVGSHLVLHLLENNESVRAIYRNPETISKTKSVFLFYKKELLFEKIEWVCADITNIPSLENAFQDIQYVYHCAALISFDPKDEKQLRKVNIEGTANIVNFCLAYNVRKLCHISSIAALGDLKNSETIVNEETEWNPEIYHNDYAISKYGGEIEVFRGQQEGLEVAIINPGIILGPCFWETGSGEIFTKIKKGFPFYTKGSTGFVAVDDVVEIMIQLMKRDLNGERFIAIADNISFDKTARMIAEALSVNPPSIYARPWMTGIGWRLDWIASNIFKRNRRLSKAMSAALHNADVISNKKTFEVLDYNYKNTKDYIAQIAKSLNT